MLNVILWTLSGVAGWVFMKFALTWMDVTPVSIDEWKAAFENDFCPVTRMWAWMVLPAIFFGYVTLFAGALFAVVIAFIGFLMLIIEGINFSKRREVVFNLCGWKKKEG